MKVLVCGGRDYRDEERVFGELDALDDAHVIDQVWHGDCDYGADHYADLWAKARHVPCVRYAANWLKHGRQAGPARNSEMAKAFKFADGEKICLAFPGGNGTADMVKKARAAGIKVVEVSE